MVDGGQPTASSGTDTTGAHGRLVLISGRDPLRTSGGSESYVVAHARAAILAGYEPHIFTIAPRPAVLDTDFGVVHRVASPVRPPRSITSVLQRPFLVPRVTRFLAGEPGPHVIHAFGAWADTAVAASRRLRRHRIAAAPLATVFMAIEHETSAKLTDVVVRDSRWWWAVHRLELEWVRRVTVGVERRAFRASAAVIVNYQTVWSELERRYGPDLPLRQLTYSPPTAIADPPPQAPLPEPLRGFGDPAAPLIVSVSRHDGRKGIDVLIAALAAMHVAQIPFRACLVGPGLLLSAHRALVASLGLEDRVLIPGRVPAVTPYLTNADIYVLPSRQEGSGSVAVLEALQCGACIVSSAVDGMVEDLTDGHDAVLTRTGDAVALRDALTRLIADPDRRRALGREARGTYERRFAAPVTAQALAGLYAEFGLRPARPGALATTAAGAAS